MFSRMLLVGALCVCACGGVASATTTKIKVFAPLGGGAGSNPMVATPNVDGMAILKQLPDGRVTVHVHVQDLKPLQWYGVATIIAPNSCDFDRSYPYDIYTNASGNGTFEFVLGPGTFIGAHPTVYIYQWNGVSGYSSANGAGGGLTISEFRAVGPRVLTPTDAGCDLNIDPTCCDHLPGIP